MTMSIGNVFCFIPSLWDNAKNKVEHKINKENTKCQIHNELSGSDLENFSNSEKKGEKEKNGTGYFFLRG